MSAYIALVIHLPRLYWVLEDLDVYHLGGEVALHNGPLYSEAFRANHLPFAYTPFAALAFSTTAGIGFAVLKVLMAAASLAAVAGSAWFALGLAGVRDRVPATMTVAAVGIWLDPVSQTLTFGQINLLLMVAVLADLSRRKGQQSKGLLTGLAAGIKLTPLIFSAHLMLTRRFRTALVSLGVVAATIAVSFAALPSQSTQYWIDGKIDSLPHEGTGYGGNQSLYGMIERFTRDGPALHPMWLAAVVVTGICGLLLAAWAHERNEVLLGICLTADTGLLISPISWSHHWVWAVPMFIWAAVRLPRLLAWPTASILLVAFIDVPKNWHPVPGSGDPGPLGHISGWIWMVPMRGDAGAFWSGTQIFVGNLYVWSGIAFLLVATVFLSSRKTPRTMRL